MRPQPESSNTEVLAGLGERVTYHNSENGICVLRVKARGHRDVEPDLPRVDGLEPPYKCRSQQRRGRPSF